MSSEPTGFKGTPGELIWYPNERCFGPLKGAYVAAGNTEIAMVLSQGEVQSQEICEANAKLLHASKHLLAACQAALGWLEHLGHDAVCNGVHSDSGLCEGEHFRSNTCEQIRAAIENAL